MAENSKIEWTTHTFNPWWGCTKVAEGCKFCYAESFSKRVNRAAWGPRGSRVKTSDANWNLPLRWNRNRRRDLLAAPDVWERTPPPRVFCASMADVFEDWDGHVVDHKGTILDRCVNCGDTRPSWRPGTIPDEVFDLDCSAPNYLPLNMNDLRRDLFALIDATPHLDWLLLTKRPGNIRKMWPWDTEYHPEPPREPYKYHRRRSNVWLGCSVSTQAEADKYIPELLDCHDLAPVLFVSAEPQIESVDLTQYLSLKVDLDNAAFEMTGIDWVIVGGESGPKARPFRIKWAESLVEQCKAAGVACFVKQLGSNPEYTYLADRMKDPKGGDPDEWPIGLRVRQFPNTESKSA